MPTLNQALSPYNADLLEAQVLWGKDAKQRLTQIVSKIDDLWLTNEDCIDALSAHAVPSNFAASAERRLMLVQIVYGQPPAREDKYKNEVDDIIATIENYLPRFLKAQTIQVRSRRHRVLIVICTGRGSWRPRALDSPQRSATLAPG